MTIDLTLNKRSKIASYRALLQIFVDSGFSFFTHAHFFEYGAFDGKAMYLRHDADRNIEIALLMARIENEMGIKSTYYLLPPGDYEQLENYYGAIVGDRLVPSARLKEVALEIAGLGHEIGLHNDFVQLSEKLGRRVEDVILEQIAYFGSIGIAIRGTASHGSEFVKGHGFINYQIFSECKQAKNEPRSLTLSQGRTFELFGISYRQLGLEYEAYSIKRDTYLSDSSGVFSVNKAVFEQVDFTALKASLANSKSAVALIHPDWWIDPLVKPVKNVKSGKKKKFSQRLAGTLRKLFPFGKKIQELQKQLQASELDRVSLREKLYKQGEKLVALSERNRDSTEKLEEQRQKSAVLYERNKQYAERLNKKFIVESTVPMVDELGHPQYDLLDYKLDGKSKVSSYRALLGALLNCGFAALTHLDGSRQAAGAAKNLYVRHDVDHDLETALGMAHIENQMGIRSTYYLLPPGDYNKNQNYYGSIIDGHIIQSARLEKVALEIQALGHEIGLHNDFVQLSAKTGRTVSDLIAGEIEYFGALGIAVRGSASHGSAFVRGHKFANYEIFKDCWKKSSVARNVALSASREFELYSIDMQDLSLDYEAYHIRRDGYISDTASRFSFDNTNCEAVDLDVLAAAVAERQRVVLLIHPEWWKPRAVVTAQPLVLAADAA